jgi:flagellar hook-associated protein 2
VTTISTSGSSIDVNGIVAQLMTIEKQPLTKLQQTSAGIDTKISAVSRVQSLLGTFQDTVRTLNDARTWSAMKATSSDDTAVGITAATDAIAQSLSVQVSQLAQRQAVSSGAFASADTVVGSGTIQIQMGTYTQGTNTFVADASRAATPVTIAAGSSVSQIRDAINSANAGVTATLVNDNGQSRLLIRSNDTGQSNSFRMTVVDDDGTNTNTSGLSQIAFNPTAATGSGKNLTLNQAALNATFTVNGLSLSSKSNTVDNVMDGVSLTLKKVTSSAVDLKVESDTSTAKTAIDKFVSAYNQLNAALSELTRYDAATKKGGTLQSESSVVSVQRKLRDVVGSTIGTGSFSRLSDVGIQIQRDGSLLVSANKLSTATNADLKTLFSNVDSVNSSNTGFSRRFDSMVTDVIGTDGSITGALNTLRKRKESIQTDQDRINVRLTQTEARLRRLYSNLDASLTSSQNQSAMIAARLSGS